MRQVKSRFDEGKIDGFKDTCRMVERRWLRKKSVKNTLIEYLKCVRAHNSVFGLGSGHAFDFDRGYLRGVMLACAYFGELPQLGPRRLPNAQR